MEETINTYTVVHSSQEMRDLRVFLYQNTICMVTCVKNKPKQGIEHCSSGVLVRILDDYFILTAGHVIKSVFAQNKTVFFLIDRAGRPRPIFNRKSNTYKTESVYDPQIKGADYGYVKIDKITAESWQSEGAFAFINLNRLNAGKIEDIDNNTNTWILCGYPKELVEQRDEAVKFQPLMIITTSEDHEASPRSPFEVDGALQLWIPDKDLKNIENGETVGSRQLNGMSGGGSWSLDMVNGTRLSAIHVATGKHGDTGEHQFTTAVSIRNHLKLLYNHEEHLKDHLKMKYYNIEDW